MTVDNLLGECEGCGLSEDLLHFSIVLEELSVGRGVRVGGVESGCCKRSSLSQTTCRKALGDLLVGGGGERSLGG